ncbi:hypothetical protein FLAG1_04827 [Fusarium langsethiae]|uniref:Uncharacterized protein n=1 Tax=Fusarium langsethiae TaxID=179993 RepID=A0A0M9EYK5_FUSLA|nr:hypothetical protein FLAG1_04827 [Fusarium langsethiae]
MAALSRASCVVGTRPTADDYPHLQDEEYSLPEPVRDDSRVGRAVTVPYVPAQDPTPVIIADPTWDKEYTFSWYRPRQTKVPEWSTRVRQPMTSTEELDGHVFPFKMTQETVSIPTTVSITKPTAPLVWWTLPDPENRSINTWNTVSATHPEPTVTSSTVPESTTAPKPTTSLFSTATLEPTETLESTASLEPTATLEPTPTPTPKGKPKDSIEPAIAGVIGGIVLVGVFILVAWLLYRRYKRNHAKKTRPTIVHPFRRDLPAAPEPQSVGRQSRSYWLPDTPSDRQSTFTRHWRDAFRMWMRVPGRSHQDQNMGTISEAASVYNGRPVGNSPPSVNPNTRPAGNPYLSPQPYTARPVSNSPSFSIPRRPVNSVYPSANTTPRPVGSPYLAPNSYTTQAGRNWRPSQYSESVYSQPGPGVRPDSGRPLDSNWI